MTEGYGGWGGRPLRQPERDKGEGRGGWERASAKEGVNSLSDAPAEKMVPNHRPFFTSMIRGDPRE